MFNPLEHLQALRTFEVAARLNSFSAAAKELGVTAGAVSKMMRSLEAQVGFPIFERFNRGVRTTEQGSRLMADVAPAFDRLRAMASTLQAETESRPLVIASPAAFLLRWLIPRQHDLQSCVGQRQIATATWDKPADLDVLTINAFIGVGPTPPATRGARVHVLMKESFALVLHPRLMVPGKSIASSLAAVPRLTPQSRPNIWRDWEAESGETIMSSGEVHFERMFFALQAAEAGLGATIAPLEIVHDSLRTGTLTAPLGAVLRSGTYHLTVPQRELSSASVQAATRWFRRRARRDADTAPVLVSRKPADFWAL